MVLFVFSAFMIMFMTPEFGDDNDDLSVLAGYSTHRRMAHIRPLAEIERAYIEMAIGLCGGNISRAAECLGISPSTIYRKKMQWD